MPLGEEKGKDVVLEVLKGVDLLDIGLPGSLFESWFCCVDVAFAVIDVGPLEEAAGP